jgi:hypothetical protein
MWYNLCKASKIRGKDRKFYPAMDLTGKEFEAQGMDIPEFIVTVVEGLHASGYQAYIVGGAVRDYCLQRMVTDWDVERDQVHITGYQEFLLKAWDGNLCPFRPVL